MVKSITLTASMRSNLNSLKNISKQMNTTQERLSTGKKVNSAIDNASSYYQARSLTNRASDLDALLDAMGQGIQTIQAANEGITGGLSLLGQLAAVTEQTLTEAEMVSVPSSVTLTDNVDELVAQGYTKVTKDTTIAEFKALLETDNAKIVLADDVTFNASFSFYGNNVTINGGGHLLKTDGLFAYGEGATFENMRVENRATGNVWAHSIYSNGKNAIVRNVEVTQTDNKGCSRGIRLNGSGGVIENVTVNMSSQTAEELEAIYVGSSASITGVSINLTGAADTVLAGIVTHTSTVTVFDIGMSASGAKKSYGIVGLVNGVETTTASNPTTRPDGLYNGEANTKAILDQIGEKGLAASAANQFYVGDKDGAFGQGTWYLPSIGEWMEFYGTDTSQMTNGYGSTGAKGDSKNLINAALNTLAGKGVEAEALGSRYYWSSSEHASDTSWLINGSSGNRFTNSKYNNPYALRCSQLLKDCFDPLSLSAGAPAGGAAQAAPKVGDVMYEDKTWGSAADYDGSKKVVGVIAAVSADGRDATIINLKDLTFSSNDTAGNFDPDNPYGGTEKTTWWCTRDKYYEDITGIENFAEVKFLTTVNPDAPVVTVEGVKQAFPRYATETYQAQYNKILEQYNKLINDSSYQGVNLLKNEKLDVVFNETRKNKLTVQGKDISTEGLGLTLADWAKREGLLQSVQELKSAVSSLRTFSSELGNNYSIIQTRQNFTEALTDVLETGADNLVLADMNEESANYLALQTRQQLATNALSLAANSAQSILALFG